jgi:hypothetical protein
MSADPASAPPAECARPRVAIARALFLLPALVGVAAALLLPAAPVALAQEAPADVPAGPATIRGHLLHAERPEATREVAVILYALNADGEPGLRRTTSDADGAFAFEGISNDPLTIYLVGTQSGDVPFGARVAFAEGELERVVEIPLSDASADVRGVTSGEARVRFGRGCTHVRVRHSHALDNSTQEVFYVPPAERASRAPLLRVEIPDDASGFEAPSAGFAEGIEQVGSEVRFWGPLYPGSQDVEFGYGLPGGGDEAGGTLTLRLGFPDGAAGVGILTPRGDMQVTGEGIAPADTVQLPGGLYDTAEAGALAPDAELTLTLELQAPAAIEGIALSEARLWLELDDAALDVNEQHELSVDSEVPLVSTGDAPLLCVPLPVGAEGLRFSNASLAMGLSRDPSGALALHGPVPPGESTLALRYRVPVREEPLRFERRFGADLPLLGILLADNGILPETDRLHRRRPVRTEDRSYLHLEAFTLGRGEPIDVTLHRIERRAGMPRLAAAGFVLLVAAAALWFLLTPLQAPEEGPTAAQATLDQRESIYRALEDLEDDFETGKLSAEDRDRMRGELRAQAVALLRAERETRATAAEAALAGCPACGTEARAGDRFCSQCGEKLEVGEAAG